MQLQEYIENLSGEISRLAKAIEQQFNSFILGKRQAPSTGKALPEVKKILQKGK